MISRDYKAGVETLALLLLVSVPSVGVLGAAIVLGPSFTEFVLSKMSRALLALF